MRYRLRLTRSIAATVFLVALLYIYIFNKLPTSFTKLPSFYNGHLLSTPGIPAFNGDVQSLWGHWSKIFYDTRPLTQHIRLTSDAQTISISPDDNGPREAPKNRVANSEADIESLRSSHAAFLEILRAEDLKGDIFNGTGIVTVGGGEYFGPAIIGLHMLRKTECSLPVEIFVADESEYETQLCEEYLPTLGARCLVLTDFLKDEDKAHTFKVTHYQLKSLAMLFSSFAEILYLDSDSIILVNPSTELFSTEPYKSTGLVVWPDFWISTESPLFYTIAGLPSFPSDLPKSSSEAGQLLLNKNTHLKTLLLAIYYNIYGPNYYYPLLSQGVLGQGDKETFMAAALVVGEPFYRVKTGVATVGRHNGKEFRGSGMIQRHASDDFLHAESESSDMKVRPAFLHANTPKMNAGHLVDEGDLTNTSQERLRLWGSKEKQEELFGVDLEKVVV
jgi:alpha 1,2-mannosyltransferase